MRRCCMVLCLMITAVIVFAQHSNPAIDTLNRRLSKATTPGERVRILGDLSKVYINENFRASDSLGRMMIEAAELSRDRELMAEALLVNGERNSYFASRKENFDQAVTYYNKALELAKTNKLDRQIARSYLALSSVYRALPDADKAFGYVNQALSYVTILNDDSLKTLSFIELGSVYGLKREKLLSLRNYLSALRIAEDMKDIQLERACYTALIGFYTSIDDYDKAIDYAVKAMDMLDQLKEKGNQYNKPVALNMIGTLYSQKEDYEMANYYFQKSLKMADSLRYDPLKIPAYMGMLNNYLNAGKPAEALEYLNNNAQLREFGARFGLGYQIDYAYGYIYTDMGKFDSAKARYNRAAPFFETGTTEANKYSFYYQEGRMQKLSGNNKEAIGKFQKASGIAFQIGDPERIKLVAKELDTLYQNIGDYRSSKQYASMYYVYKDSIDKLGKEKDLLQAEASDEQQRQIRKQKEEEDILRRKNNIQYSAITIGIAALLVVMVVLGMFKVSAGFIKAVGFFTFLMLFEFIFLVFKKNIHSITHGEPWKDLAFMIGLAALLVPLHHWVEHRVLHYLTSHNRLTRAGHHIKSKLFGRTNEDQQ
ncbi:MAG: tetratricopeptide repeat protein [Chitinophagaceae bacterium]